ncbi:MAG: GNAT family N-acetyltransferase [Acidobacteriota bacterium]
MRTFAELRSDADIARAFPLMAALRDRIRVETFAAEVRRQHCQGYELIGAFEDGALVALAGVRRTHTLSRGEHVFVDDLVTEEQARGRGHGAALLRWIATRAAAEGVTRLHLDSRLSARGFYEQAGFTFHSSIPCWVEIPKFLAEPPGVL